MPRVLGDIIICTNVVKSKLTHLGIHLKENLDFSASWILHLLGYDHMNEEDEKVMFSRQDTILNAYGLTRD